MFIENVKLALTALMANKLRTFLTMLGIIIGIAAVIAIMTIGESSVEQTKQQYANMGVNLIEFYTYLSDSVDATTVDTNSEEYQAQFTKDMLKSAILKYEDVIDQIVMEEWLSSGKIYTEKGSFQEGYSSVTFKGVNRGFFDMPDKNFVIVAGKVFDRTTDGSDSTAIVISDKSAEILYGSAQEAIGQKLHMQMQAYTMEGEFTVEKDWNVIGVYEYHRSRGQREEAGTKPNDINYEAYIPYLSCYTLLADFGTVRCTSFAVNLKPGSDVIGLTSEMKEYIQSLMPEDGRFEVEAYSNAQYIKEEQDAVRQRNLVTTLTGAIALLVGGIGVMNIMTVSIIERTREIGTRKALGALNGDIRLQFITEAMVICVIGGMIGIVIGIAIAIGACKIQGIPLAMSYESIAISFVVSLLIGLFFGYYPANKAAKMDPIEALRYE